MSTSLSHDIRELLIARGHRDTGDKAHDEAVVGMTGPEAAALMGITEVRAREKIGQLMAQMAADGLMRRVGKPRSYRYIVTRNPKPGAGGRGRQPREVFLAKRRAINEKARRRKGMRPLEEYLAERRQSTPPSLPLSPAMQAKQLKRASQSVRDNRICNTFDIDKRTGNHPKSQRRNVHPDIAPTKAPVLSSEEFVRAHAHDPSKFERLPTTACRAPLRFTYDRETRLKETA